MISHRCTTHNLVNHLQQTNKIKNYEVNYIYEKNNYKNEWMCVVSFDDGSKHQSYTENADCKKKSIDSILKKIYPVLSQIAGIKK